MGAIIPFPILEIYFGIIGSNKHVPKEVFWSENEINPFPVSETYFGIIGSNKHHVPKEIFWSNECKSMK